MDEAARASKMNAVPEISDNSTVSVTEGPRRVIALGCDDPADKAATDTTDGEELAPLFAQEVAGDFRARWVVVQQGFVDDPRRAVEEGDELVKQVMSNLADSFTKERTTLKERLGESDKTSTELLRVALRRHRSFFERLLSF